VYGNKKKKLRKMEQDKGFVEEYKAMKTELLQDGKVDDDSFLVNYQICRYSILSKDLQGD